MSELTDRVKALYERTHDLDFVSGELGLSSPEMRVLAALLVAGGNYGEARALLPAFDKLTFDRQAVSLHTKGFVGREDSRIVFDESKLRLQLPDEPVRERGEAPHIKVVRRSIRDRVLYLMAEQPNVKGLAAVYSELYGGEFKKYTFGQLGKVVNALGPSRAGLFLLEFAHKPMADPLNELMPLAVARGKGYGNVVTAEVVEARKANNKAMNDAALQSRLKIYASFGGDIPEHLREQYEKDMRNKR